MKASFQLGCLKHAEWMRREQHAFDSRSLERNRENYACSPTAIEMPEDGATSEDVYCPHCAQRVQLRLQNPSGQANRLLIALTAGSLGLFGLGFATYFLGQADAPAATGLMVVAFVGGTLALVPAVIVGLAQPESAARKAVTVGRDYVLDSRLQEVVAERKRHRVFDVVLAAEGEAGSEPGEATSYGGDPGSVLSGIVMN